MNATDDLTEVMGIGSYVGEIRQAPDGGLYQWQEGVDGLGNPVGFWKLIKKGIRAAGRGLKRVARRALPHVLQRVRSIPGFGPVAHQAARGVLKRTGIMGLHGPGMAPPPGIGSYVGEIQQGPDGNLYQWQEGVDGLGNPVGFWKLIKKGFRAVGRGLKRVARRVLPRALPFTRFIPGVGPIVHDVARGALKRTGLMGVHGPIMEAPDGSHYEMVQGLGEFGEPRSELRRVRLIIPAQLR